jgi:hypothetical protein
MQRSILWTLALLFAFVFFPSQAFAQAQSPEHRLRAEDVRVRALIKGKFSEVVTSRTPGSGSSWRASARVRGRRKDLFPAISTGSKYAYYRIKKLLAMHGATLKNVVFVTTYMMDIRHIGASGKCRTEEFAEAVAELPPGASVGVNAFAWPDMLLEIAATAAVEK